MSSKVSGRGRNSNRAKMGTGATNHYVERDRMKTDAAARFMRDAAPRKAEQQAATMTLGDLLDRNADLELRIAALIKERDEANEERSNLRVDLQLALGAAKALHGVIDALAAQLMSTLHRGCPPGGMFMFSESVDWPAVTAAVALLRKHGVMK